MWTRRISISATKPRFWREEEIVKFNMTPKCQLYWGSRATWLIHLGLVWMKVAGSLTWPWWKVLYPVWGALAVIVVLMWEFGVD